MNCISQTAACCEISWVAASERSLLLSQVCLRVKAPPKITRKTARISRHHYTVQHFGHMLTANQVLFIVTGGRDDDTQSMPDVRSSESLKYLTIPLFSMSSMWVNTLIEGATKYLLYFMSLTGGTYMLSDREVTFFFFFWVTKSFLTSEFDGDKKIVLRQVQLLDMRMSLEFFTNSDKK